MNTRQIGNIGEDYTVRFLEKNGCEILSRNFTIKGGEIDIVAKKGDIVHFVEVKSRKPAPYETGEEAVRPSKIAHIVKTAKVYINRYNIDCSCVFDVAVVEITGTKVTGFKYIQRAFTA
ncbi:MAG: YraN family protein [Oscillospiraceae bacterium]|nr:YraN family protein [Ruminococcus sp.]MCD8345709.1 YraN family protein [Oscillospiraceae bacterium]